MNLYGAAWYISDLIESNRSIFLKMEPEIPDHTIRSPFKILLCGVNNILELEITPENIMAIIGQFDYTIFDKDKVDRLYVWQLKDLATYFYACTGKYMSPKNSVIDLRVVEKFLGMEKKSPKNLSECVDRTKQAMLRKGWMSVYKSIHLPLILRVLPTIESTPLIDESKRDVVYPYYEIEGITSGRLNSGKRHSKQYCPHNMGSDVKSCLKPKGYGLRFMYADYKNCEISVLQHISKDERLLEMLSSNEDVYRLIYKAIVCDECDSDVKRDKAKKMMLSVMYGSGIERLAQTLSVTEPLAKELVRRIRIVFKTACDWMDSQREEAKKDIYVDYFGRPRDYRSETHKAPDIMIQGLAATVCQEKMIDLFGRLDRNKAYIAYSVHDGYGMVVKTESARETYRLVKDTLEEESKICPELKMKVEIKFGAKLDSMKVLWKD